MPEDTPPKLHIESDFRSQVESERGEADAGLHIDSDWKAQAQAEKERLAEAESQKTAGAGDAEQPPVEANFRTLIGMLAQQAIMGLGGMRDPKSGRVVVDPDGSRFSIDLLGMLEEKTKGNLSEEESSELAQVLHELRGAYVQLTQMLAEQAAAGPAGGSMGGGPGAVPPGM